MPRFQKVAEIESPEEEPAIQAPVAERGMIILKLAVPAWDEEVITIFRDTLQNWLNKAHRGELKHGDQLVLVVP